MKQIKNFIAILGKWFSIPWYFIVFSAYPVLALLASNIGQVMIQAAWRPLLISILLGGLLSLILWLILRDVYRAAFLTTLWMALFFSYGHVYLTLLKKWEKINFSPYLLITWLVLAILFYIWATRPQFTFKDAVLALNVVSL